ncbi:MAG TPA: tetratricopeptide repeat protein [Bryobacteraceae bacterium]|nr:tetratricopeptide repeat protein [Bryobacteraceae bacterium]
MKWIRISCVFLAGMPFSFGASREIVELQRDVASLQEQVRQIQKTLDEKLAAMQTLVQQSLDASNRVNSSLAVMQNSVTESVRSTREGVSAPLVSVGNKLDQMGEDFRNLRETVADMNAHLGKLDQKVTDLQNTVSIMRTPPPGAPAQSGTDSGSPATGTIPASTAPAGPPPGMTSGTLYTNATKDKQAGNWDLALQEYGDYVRWYADTTLAPNAQYYVGEIYFTQKKDYDNALQAFDNVLEHWSESNKTPDAHYMKGKTLVALGKRDAAAKEFREVLNKYPNTEVAPKCKAELSKLGLSTRTGAANRRSKR